MLELDRGLHLVKLQYRTIFEVNEWYISLIIVSTDKHTDKQTNEKRRIPYAISRNPSLVGSGQNGLFRHERARLFLRPEASKIKTK